MRKVIGMFFDCAAQRFKTIEERERETESGGVARATKTTLAPGVCIRGGYALHFFDRLCSSRGLGLRLLAACQRRGAPGGLRWGVPADSSAGRLPRVHAYKMYMRIQRAQEQEGY